MPGPGDVTVYRAVHGTLTPVRNLKAVLLNPYLKPHEIHLRLSALLVKELGRARESGVASQVWLWQVSRRNQRTGIRLPVSPLAHMSLNLPGLEAPGLWLLSQSTLALLI